ncbi:MAG: glycerate kinase [Clostridiaceae bacterium]|nr:glycerate kinase [Clostridiaceae bacterium]
MLIPDSFKGTMDSSEVIQRLEKSAKKYFNPCEFVKIPIADGGEGTVSCLLTACGGDIIKKTVTGPEREPVDASYGIIHSDTAVIEMAAASGITLLTKPKNPLHTTSYGTGELILDALNRGFSKIIIAIGGSATNDGGLGALAALGVKFFDDSNRPITSFTGADLSSIHDFDASALGAYQNRDIYIMCDVSNPLTGEFGATFVYGSQKGADDEMLQTLEEGMIHFAKVVKQKLGISHENDPGAGAAGGLGFALKSFLKAKMTSGIEMSLDIVEFDQKAVSCDLIVTGEGSVNAQSVFGKVPIGIARRAKRLNIPVIAIAGSIMDGAEQLYEHGIVSISPVICRAMDIEQALANSGEMFDKAADRMFRLLSVGIQMGSPNTGK